MALLRMVILTLSAAGVIREATTTVAPTTIPQVNACPKDCDSTAAADPGGWKTVCTDGLSKKYCAACMQCQAITVAPTMAAPTTPQATTVAPQASTMCEELCAGMAGDGGWAYVCTDPEGRKHCGGCSQCQANTVAPTTAALTTPQATTVAPTTAALTTPQATTTCADACSPMAFESGGWDRVCTDPKGMKQCGGCVQCKGYTTTTMEGPRDTKPVTTTIEGPCDTPAVPTTTMAVPTTTMETPCDTQTTTTVEAPCSTDSVCDGFEEESAVCTGLPACVACTPQNCVFDPWTDWAPMGGCIELCERARIPAVEAQCDGNPCTGTRRETKRCKEARCASSMSVNCTLGQWTDWDASGCVPSNLGQQRRTRAVVTEASGRGVEACEGDLAEVKTCEQPRPTSNCTVSEWSMWTACTASCGPGYRSRSRDIAADAINGGICPPVDLSVGEPCDMGVCPDQDCVFQDWSPWSAEVSGRRLSSRRLKPLSPDMAPTTPDDESRVEYTFRFRPIAQQATFDGKRCNGSSNEVQRRGFTVEDCHLTTWGPWTACTNTCGGGQHSRQRRLVNYSGGECPQQTTEEVEGCNPRPCPGSVCVLSQWSAWTPCSKHCGIGIHSRERTANVSRGTYCNDVLQEVRPCDSSNLPVCTSEVVDCAWGMWKEWTHCVGGCDQTCGNGTRTRSRVIANLPLKGGKPCDPLQKAEMETCALAACTGECVDAQWSAWTHWLGCNPSPGHVTAGHRNRYILRQANHCGKSVVGVFEEYKECRGAGPPCGSTDADCVIGAWSVWSACNPSCYGVRTRTRNATQARGNGVPCVDTSANLEEIKPCNPGVGEAIPAVCNRTKDCKLGGWTEWSVQCVNGMRYRNRAVLQEAQAGGWTCQNKSTRELKRCPTDPFRCKDCEFYAWEPWSACSGPNGVQSRVRSKLADLSRRRLQEAGACADMCAGMAGDFGGWSDICAQAQMCSGCTQCQATIVATTVAPTTVAPTTTQAAVSDCPDMCGGFAGDSGWPTTCKEAKGTCSGCAQCKATIVATTVAPTIATVAPTTPQATTSTTSTTSTTTATTTTTSTTTTTTQQLEPGLDAVKQFSDECGLRCERKATREIQKCGGPAVAPQSTQYCVWSEWVGTASQCIAGKLGPQSCGPNGNYRRTRSSRFVTQLPASYMFKVDSLPPANTVGTVATPNCSMKQVNMTQCPGGCQLCAKIDCSFSAWSQWTLPTACRDSCTRSRQISAQPQCGGVCTGFLTMSKSCSATAGLPKDCTLSVWTPWTPWITQPCTMGETRTRSRDVTKGDEGGKVDACVGTNGEPLVQQDVCLPVQKTEVDCTFSGWESWSVCSETCGMGTMTRQRLVQTLSNGGKLCVGNKKEVAVCNKPACPIATLPNFSNAAGSCDAWTPWDVSKCGTDTVTVGHKTRSRNMFSKLGVACLGLLTEIAPCTKVPDRWGNWSRCSHTCGGGSQTRVLISSCVLYSAPTEVRSCNTAACPDDHDAVPHEWQAWSSCSATCGRGSQSRKRVSAPPNGYLVTAQSGYGSGWKGDIEEIKSCDVMLACPPPRNCSLLPWQSWSGCSLTCGGGVRLRRRHNVSFQILVAYPEKVNDVVRQAEPGGNYCKGTIDLIEQEGCNLQVCPKGCTPATWTNWSNWSTCYDPADPNEQKKCISDPNMTGIQYRHRAPEQVKHTIPCPHEGRTRQYKTCSLPVCPQVKCEFGPWSPWTNCTGGCDESKRRSRAIAKTGTAAMPCVGPLKEISSCPVCKTYLSKPPNPVDCKFSEWSVGECSGKCGNATRSRNVIEDARNGGRSCNGTLKEIIKCQTEACNRPVVVDCKWGEWAAWGPCSRCGPTGQRTRSREVKTLPYGGGKACEPGDSEQIKTCDTPCGKKYCEWGDWQAWGGCSSTCGFATKTRRRHLLSTFKPPQVGIPPKSVLDTVGKKYAVLHAQISQSQARRSKDMAVAFTVGALTCLVLLLSIHTCASRSKATWSRTSPSEAPELLAVSAFDNSIVASSRDDLLEVAQVPRVSRRQGQMSI